MADIKIKIILEGGQFKGEAKEVEAAVNEVSGKVQASFDSMTAKITAFSFSFNQISDLAAKAARVLEAPLNTFMAFETPMANVASLGVDNMRQLNAAVLDAAADIPVALDSLTSGLYDVVSAGVDAANQMYVLEQSAKAAKAGLASTSEALNLGSAVIKAYGKDWSETGSVMDQAFQTVKLGQTTFGELASSIGVVAPLAATLKVSTQELFGVFSTLTGVTGSASEVATQYRGILAGLADPTDNLKNLIEQTTGKTIEQTIAQDGLSRVLKIVREATGGSASKMTELFGRIEAVNAVLALSGEQYDTFIAKTVAMKDSAGAMETAFKTQADTLESSLQLLDNRWQVIQITLLSGVVPALAAVVDAGADVLEWLTGADEGVSGLEKSFRDLQSEISEYQRISDMLEEYDQLATKTKLSADETERLKDLTQRLAEIYPEAVTQINTAGEAMRVNSGYIREMVEAQKELLRVEKAEIFEGAKEKLKSYLDVLANGPVMVRALSFQLENNRKLYGEHSRAVLDSKNKLIELQKQVKEAHKNLPGTLRLLSNFANLKTADGIKAIADEIGLTADQVAVLENRLKSIYGAQQSGGDVSSGGSGGSAPSGGSGGGAPRKIAVQYELPDDDFIETAMEEQISAMEPPEIDMITPFSEQLDQRLSLLDLYHQTGVVSEEEYQARHLQLLQEGYEHYAHWEGAKSERAQEYLAQRLTAEKQFAKQREALEQRAMQTFTSALAGMMSAYQGQSRAMFEIGKAGAIAHAMVNTYSAATAAYKSLSGIPVVGPALGFAAAAAIVAAGLANVHTIESTKFEKKKEGGPLGQTDRVLRRGDYGDGENLIFAANDGEFLLRAEAYRANPAAAAAINEGRPAPEIMAALQRDSGYDITVVNRRLQQGGVIINNLSAARTENQAFPPGSPPPGVSAPQQVKASIDEESVRVLTEAISNIQIQINSTLDALSFYRDTFPDYQDDQRKRTIE